MEQRHHRSSHEIIAVIKIIHPTISHLTLYLFSKTPLPHCHTLRQFAELSKTVYRAIRTKFSPLISRPIRSNRPLGVQPTENGPRFLFIDRNTRIAAPAAASTAPIALLLLLRKTHRAPKSRCTHPHARLALRTIGV